MWLKNKETPFGTTAEDNLNRFFVLFFLLFGVIFVFLTMELKAQEILPLDQVKPGLKCYGLTVLKGQTPQKIKLEIVGDINHPSFNEKRLILAEPRGGTFVAGGMSGSPIYCENKLLGSLSMQLGAFPVKKNLIGITPINYMRDQQGSLGKKSAGNTMSTNIFSPIPIVAFTNSDSSALINQINRDMPSKNFTFMLGTAGGLQKAVSQQLGTIAPGDSITMFFAKGAFEASGTCTVTEVTDRTFSACGHAVLGEGEIQLPTYKSSVAYTFYSSSDSSSKLIGEILEPVGTVTYDNAFAIEGVRELSQNIMIPVNLLVTVDSDSYDYQFEVFRHKFYTSLLVKLGTQSLLKNLWADKRLGTARLAAKIYLQGRAEPIEIYDADLISSQLVQLGFLEGYADPWQILRKFQNTLVSIQQSEWNFAIERVELTLNIWDGNRILDFDSMAVLDRNDKPVEEIRAGDKLNVILGIRSKDSTQKLVKRFAIEIPNDLKIIKPQNETTAFLPAMLYIMSGTKYQETDPKKLPKAQPDSAEEFIKMLGLNQRDPSEIFAALILPLEYQSDNQDNGAFTELKDGVWNSVNNLEFLRERKDASEPRVIYLPLGAPLKDAIVSFAVIHQMKLMLK